MLSILLWAVRIVCVSPFWIGVFGDTVIDIWDVGLPKVKFIVAGLGWLSLLQLFGTWGGGVPLWTALSLSFKDGASFNISWILRSIPLNVIVQNQKK